MYDFITMGSCLTGLGAHYLQDMYKWRWLNNCSVLRSDFAIDYLIDSKSTLPPPAVILEGTTLIPAMAQDAHRILREFYPEGFGHIGIPPEAPSALDNLRHRSVDVIVLDNLGDTHMSLTCSRPGVFEDNFSFPFSLSYFENEIEVASTRYYYDPPLQPRDSVNNWIRIIRFLLQSQPHARIYFFCAHGMEQFHSPERVSRAEEFARLLPPAARDLPIRVFPPFEPPKALMEDTDHYTKELYQAMAGLLFAEEAAGWHPNHREHKIAPNNREHRAAPGISRELLPASTAHLEKTADFRNRIKLLCDEEALDKTRAVQNPYAALPASSFWRRAVARVAPKNVDPVLTTGFRIGAHDRVATAGSCFAQHISRTLQKAGFTFLVTEAAPLTVGAASEGYGIFPARFSNIYTVRQLLQLYQRAAGLWAPEVKVWRRADGRFVDPFRPRIQHDGFASVDELLSDQAAHLDAVLQMFRQCDVFIFTLGLTEGWRSRYDGAVYPLPPGATGVEEHSENYAFVNFEVAEMIEDMECFIDALRSANSSVRIILTVSPVPLIATFEPRHVLVSNTVSKSALRSVADIISRKLENVDYFPSYEVITGVQNRSDYYEEDLREVTTAGVDAVMTLFRRHYMEEVA